MRASTKNRMTNFTSLTEVCNAVSAFIQRCADDPHAEGGGAVRRLEPVSAPDGTGGAAPAATYSLWVLEQGGVRTIAGLAVSEPL